MKKHVFNVKPSQVQTPLVPSLDVGADGDGQKGSLRKSVPRVRELGCYSLPVQGPPPPSFFLSLARQGYSWDRLLCVHVNVATLSTGDLDCLARLHTSFEPPGSAGSVRTLTLCGRHAIRMGSTSRISLILEPPFPIRDPHWLAGTTNRNVTGGLLVAGLLLMELMMS